MTRSFDVFFDLRLNKRLSKQSWGWWLETLSRPLWRQRNEKGVIKVEGRGMKDGGDAADDTDKMFGIMMVVDDEEGDLNMIIILFDNTKNN